MTTRLQWLLSALALLAIALGAAACPADNPAADSASAALYQQNCALCHGKDLAGIPGMAPGLRDIKPHWVSADELAKYLADPQGYALADQRLRENLGKYSMRMPTFPSIDEQERLALSRWLLAQ